MFDWDDEELTNIIWGEAGESDDHIVPYPDKVEDKPQVLFGDVLKKEACQGTSNVNFLEQKKSNLKSENRVELASSPRYGTHDPERGYSLNSWPDGSDASLSNTAKGDQDSTSGAASNDLTKSTKDGTITDGTAQFKEDSTLFQNQLEDRDDGDFVDYDWANIGSFEDLDNIFSNNEPFGDISVGNADELWLSTKDVTSNHLGAPLSGDSSDLPLKTTRTSADGSETKAPYMLDPAQSFKSNYEMSNEGTSNPPQDVQASLDTVEQYGGKNKIFIKEKGLEMSAKSEACHKQHGDVSAATANELPGKGTRQKRLLKGQMIDKRSEVRQPHDVCSTWSSSGSPFPQVNNAQYRLPVGNPCPPMMLPHHSQFPRPELLQQNHFSGHLLASPLYGSMVNHYPVPSVLAAPSPHEVPSASSNPNSMKKSMDANIKPPAMSPREKIEKLRRRQKMRAMLAIKRQQQQFGNQATVIEHPTGEVGKLEVDETLSSFPSIDTASPVDRDESNTNSVALDNCSIEESVLRRLQDTIANLDTGVRLSIRDSLYRLAQSAMRRQYPNDTNSASTSGKGVLCNQNIDSHERFTSFPDIEADTNPIDRTVAHLLFHRPLESSAKPAETPESPASANVPFERMESSSLNLADVPESLKNNQLISPQGSNPRGLFSGDTSEIASANDNGDGATKIVEDTK